MALPEDPIPEEFFSPGPDERTRGFVPEFVRKMAVAGLGALFMTEEGLRALAGQLKLPKEALSYVLSQAERTKDELGRVVSEEIRRFLQSEKLRDEFLKLLTGMTIEVKAEVRLLPRKDKGDGESKVELTELHARRSKKKKE
ncbi:MAG: hypothetical protein ACOZIN_20365 [Myxococcota bacterium]